MAAVGMAWKLRLCLWRRLDDACHRHWRRALNNGFGKQLDTIHDYLRSLQRNDAKPSAAEHPTFSNSRCCVPSGAVAPTVKDALRPAPGTLPAQSTPLPASLTAARASSRVHGGLSPWLGCWSKRCSLRAPQKVTKFQ